MAVIGSIRKLYEGHTASVTDEQETYTIVYGVDVNDPTDGPVVVINAPGLPRIGQAYNINSREHRGAAVCVELKPTRENETRLKWRVEATFQTPSPEEQTGGGSGASPTDVESWYPEMDISAATVSLPLEEAILRTALPGTRKINERGPVTNSANQVFDPAYEIERSQQVIRITINRWVYPNAIDESYRDAINHASYRITAPAGYARTFPPFTLKMLPVTGSLQRLNLPGGRFRPYWKIIWEFHERNLALPNGERLTWRVRLVDRGAYARAKAGDYDGHGGTIVSAEIAAGMPHNRGLYDVEGNPINEPVLLNGSGAPLEPGKPAVFITYSGLPELDFTKIPLFTSR